MEARDDFLAGNVEVVALIVRGEYDRAIAAAIRAYEPHPESGRCRRP